MATKSPGRKVMAVNCNVIKPIQSSMAREMFHHYGSVYKRTTGLKLINLVERDVKQIFIMALSVASSHGKKVLQPTHLQTAMSFFAQRPRLQIQPAIKITVSTDKEEIEPEEKKIFKKKLTKSK